MLVILYERAGKILPNAHLNILWGVWSIDLEATDDPNQPRCKNSWSKHKSYVLLCFLLFLISLLVSVCNLTETHGARSCRLHGDWKCLNLPSHFLFFFSFLPPCCSRLKLEPQQQTRASCPFPSPGAACLSASLPDSHGPMIDCSLSAFVPGNCFVLLTVCLCSSPDSRDSMPPFLTYLPNMFKTWLKWITVEYVEVEDGWGGHRNVPDVHTEEAERTVCLCVTGLRENQMHTLKLRVRLYLRVCSWTVCPLWGLMWALLENVHLKMVGFLEIEDKNWGFFKWEDFGKDGRLEFGFVRLGLWGLSGVFYQP